ncbi:hypothetical protein [Amycolatopsis sp. PS_44_ISF1]|uniref:hypothetical protein n=1 Tax=Amycolatopsis sp. PS_44_ISF1 TaxID=2974917 RepID=UPI0028DF5B72|nr:hypothetical protein [Amycolatopsis sp. PS_44_ISF1]MDT8915919.1 hypothetical protein [Amycolatopsis sp. PS_44_ISF1]
MGAGFEVVPASVGESAERAHRAAAAVRPVDLAGALSGVPAGLPGGASAEAAARLAEVWGHARTRWISDVEVYGGRLDRAARGYRGADERAGADIQSAR